MELTVGFLKKVFAELDDDVIIATLGIGNESFDPFISAKRLIVLQGSKKWWHEQKFLAINEMGSHFSGRGDQSELKPTGQYFDEDSFNTPSK